MTVEELAGKRYGGEFVFMFGHLEGRTRFVFECFDPRPSEESCSRKLLEELVEERISVLLKDRKKKVVSIFFTILIMVVCKAVM